MSSEDTVSLANNRMGRALPKAATVLVGLLAGLLVIRLLGLGWPLALLSLSALALVLVCLDGYRAWVLLLAVSLVSGIHRDVGDFTIRPEHVVLLALMAGWSLSLLAGKVRLHRVPMLLPLLGLIGTNFISTALFSPDKSHSYHGAILLSMYAFMYVITVLVLRDHPEKGKSAIKILLVLGVLQAAYALVTLVGYYGGINLGDLTPYTDSGGFAVRLQGGFQESDMLGDFMAVMALILIALLTARQKSIKPRNLIIGLLFVLPALALAFARASWIGFIVGLIVLLFIQKPPRNIFNPKAVVVMLVFAALGAFALLPAANTLTNGLTNSISDRASYLIDFSGGSGAGRLDVQKQAWSEWEKAQIMGMGTVSLPEMPGFPRGWVFSSGLQTLHDTGLLGLAFLLWAQGGMLVVVIKGYLKARDQLYRASLAGFIVASIATLIASQASSVWWLGFPWIVSGLAVAVAVNITSGAEPQLQETDQADVN